MKKEKKIKYEKSWYVGIHTINGTTDAEVEVSTVVEPCIKACSKRKKRNKEEYETYLQINPNKLDNELITSYSQFCNTLNYILQGCDVPQMEDFTLKRADLCFNSDDEEDFLLFKKLHKLLISCQAEAFSFRNCYEAYDMWSAEPLNVAIKNDFYEAENYSKFKESNGTDQAKNRLEIRSKRINGSDLQHEFLQIWVNRLRESIECFENVQLHYNRELEKKYKADLQKPKKQRDYASLTMFLMVHKDCIFSSWQMKDLLSRFDEVQNPTNRAKEFKRKHEIEYFSKSDLKFCVDVLEDKMKTYFES